jgi:DNA-binding MarR family transcriptional regulator
VTFLARRTLHRVVSGKRRSDRLSPEKARTHRRLMRDAVALLGKWLDAPTASRRRDLGELYGQMKEEQNEYKNIRWGAVRIVPDADLLLVEYTVGCVLYPDGSGAGAYQTARYYAERYDTRFPSGLVPKSAPLVQDIVDFWVDELGIDREALRESARRGKEKSRKPPAAGRRSTAAGRPRKKEGGMSFTHRQGQFLAFIYLFRKLHRRGPAETDMAQFFGLTPPAVHGMVVKLGQLGLVTREPGVARSVRVSIPEEEIPALEDVEGPSW